MSMVAHGYGIAAIGMPNLIFSNVVWGYLVRAIPQMNGILGYSIATTAVLVVIAVVMLHGLRKLGMGWVVSFAVMILLLVRPVLFPQFTINAGLLTVGALICWNIYGREKNRQALLIGCLLAFCGYLVRSHEFLLVLLIALPLLPWRALARDPLAQAAAVALLIAISVAAFVDHRAYQDEVWKTFNELNPARAPITDFGAGGELKKKPELLARHGYTANDIDLIQSWFFVDANIANPAELKTMLAELGPTALQSNAVANGWAGLKAFAQPVLLPTFIAALFLACALPSRTLLATWALCIVAIFALGLLGRPGVLRVYIPVVSLLLIAPFIASGAGCSGVWKILLGRLSEIVIVLAAVFNTMTVFSESRFAQSVSNQIMQNMKGFSDHAVVIWGSVFPFESLYPVFMKNNSIMTYSLYGLGVFTHAPFSLAKFEEIAGRGLISQLVSKSGVPIIATEQNFALLNIYCKERLDGVLNELLLQQYGQLRVSWRQCAPNVRTR